MKHTPFFTASIFVALGAAGALSAADLIKADNATALNQASSYTNASGAPTNADWIIFDATFASTTAVVASGGSIAMRGLRVTDPGNDVTIALGNSLFSVGANGVASGQIDLSSATRNLTFTSSGSFGALRLYGSAPSITVAAGRTLTVNAPVFVFNTNGGSLVVSGAGAVNLNGEVRNGDADTRTTRVVHTGSGVLTLGGANIYTGGTAVESGTVAISQNFAMGASSANAIGLNAAAGTHGEMTFGGDTLTYGGSLRIDIAGLFSAGGTFDLIDLGAGVSSGRFASVSVAGSYDTDLVNDGFGVWSGSAGGATFVFDQASGDLTVSTIPEPSSAAVWAGFAGLVAVLGAKRRR
jgi:autotransporter-associated beta strand protein